MGRIQSTVGLVTGLPIQETVDQLLTLKGIPRDNLTTSVSNLQAKQLGVSDLLARVLGVQISARGLGKTSLFDTVDVGLSVEGPLSISTTGTPAPGSYDFTPVRKASAQQYLSTGFSSKTNPLGAGTLRLRRGNAVDDSRSLDLLNGGQGVRRGKIRITDRSGTTAVVDLTFAKSVDDVLEAINSNASINVIASTDGDAIKLTDQTGLSSSNLRVQEFGTGSTAADLGIGGINTASDSATGSDIYSLFEQLTISSLNDGAGLSLRTSALDLSVTLSDGTSVDVDILRAGVFAQSAGTTNASDANSQVTITAVQEGGDYDDVNLVFTHSDDIVAGSETVVYDDSDPNNKTLTVSIQAGVTTAAQVADAINDSSGVPDIFQASLPGDGSGTVGQGDSATTSGGIIVAPGAELTLGDVIDTINTAGNGNLTAAISADGDRIELTDHTNGGGAFTVTSPDNGELAEDLGLTGAAVNGVIQGRRLNGGLKTVLLDNLNGGQGFGTLGRIQITDRSGAISAEIDLQNAETLQDVVEAINNSGVAVTASVNASRNGIEISDDSGSTASNLIIATTDGSNTAESLNIAVNDAVDSVDSGSLQLQSISENTLLSSLNGGRGISAGTFIIRDSAGNAGTISTSTSGIETVGELIDAINSLPNAVQARINDAGDGIVLIDQANGAGTLEVEEVGTGTTASDLNLLGTAVDVNGEQQLDGSFAVTIDISDTDTLEDVVEKINGLNAGVTASLFSDGSAVTPFRLSLLSDSTGDAGRFFLDVEGSSFTFQEVSRGQDALLLFGPPGGGASVLATSSTDKFDGLVDGLSITVNDANQQNVSASVTQSSSAITSAVQLFVDQYNTLRESLDELTFFNEQDNSSGVLFGSFEALRVDTELPALLTGRVRGAGSISSLEALGVTFKDDGTLSFNEAELLERLEEDAAAVEEFFTNEENGFAKRVDDLAEQLAGEGDSLFVSRIATLQRTIDEQNSRIEVLNEQLEAERELLLTQFFRMEEAISKLQNGLSAVAQIAPLAPLVSANSSN